jgi:hypothetical protein
MDFERIKTGMKEIVKIAESVPEKFKDRCFEVLLAALLVEVAESSEHPKVATRERESAVGDMAPPSATAARGVVGEGTLPTLKGQVRVFMTRTKLSEDKLARVISYVDDEVHFIQEPKPAKLSQGQMEWALLSALKNAIEDNAFIVDGNAVRELCDEKGFLDASNFWSIFGRNTELFAKPITSADPKQSLSSDGQLALARLIESLAGG